MSNWFLVKVKFTKEMTDGTLKRVTEPYLINALSFSESEERIYKEVGELIRSEFTVQDIKRFEVADIFLYEDSEQWWSVKVSYTTEDADSGKEKKVNNTFLVTASGAEEATERTKESLKGLMATFEVTRVEKSPIVEVFPFEASENSKAKAKEKATIEKTETVTES